MTATPATQPPAPDELAARLARVGLPSGGVRHRLAVLPDPLRELHRRLLGSFLTKAGPPASAEMAGMAAKLDLDPQAALAALAAADAIHTDPATGQVSIAYPFSGRPTPHRVELAGGATVHAMCALDALGIPPMTRRDGRITSTDPTTGQPISAKVRGGVWRFEPVTTVVVATATGSKVCGSSADCCCPYINFHADPSSANAYLRTHAGLAAELFDQAEAVEAAKRVFGRLLDAGDHDQDSQR